ncbi:MAG: protein kinase [Thermosynechococcaceae cyanobacterium]
MMGQLLSGRYKLLRPLGAGGMGQTYVAEDTQRPGNPVCVVKQLKPPTNDPSFLAIAKRLFNKEAETLEHLGHHNQIPQLLAYFEHDQEFFLVQDYVDGHPLSQELGQRWPEDQVIGLLDEALSILDFVHSQGVIHRDIKPDNIMRRLKDDKLVLIDFGAVKQVRSQNTVLASQVSQSVAIGTPGYMPSEQVSGHPRPSSDLYALGKIGIQALTGLLPTQLLEDADGEVVWRQQAQVSEGLATFLTKMVHHYFKMRYQTAGEALQALRQLQAVAPTEVVPPPAYAAAAPVPPAAPVTPPQAPITSPQSFQTLPTASTLPPTNYTVPVAAPAQISEPEPSRSSVPIFIGAGLLVAGLIAGAIALQSNFNSPSPTTTISPAADAGAALLTEAQEEANGGDLGAAVKIAAKISPDSSSHADATDLIKQWQTDWDEQNDLFDQAEAALSAERWIAARNAARALPDNPYWEPKTAPIIAKANQELEALKTPTPTNSPTSAPTPAPTVEPAQGDPSGAFQDDTWQVTIVKNGDALNYQGRNLKTGDSLNLSGATVAASTDRKIYTWYNGDYQYRVSWRPSDPEAVRLQVIAPQGKELINSLLRQGG